jgi:hypothetical protein
MVRKGWSLEFGVWEWILMKEVASRMILPVFDFCKMTKEDVNG